MLSLIPAVDVMHNELININGRREQVREITPILERPGCMLVWTRGSGTPHLLLHGDMVHVERHWTEAEIAAADEAADAARRRWQLLADGGWDMGAIRAAERRIARRRRAL